MRKQPQGRRPGECKPEAVLALLLTMSAALLLPAVVLCSGVLSCAGFRLGVGGSQYERNGPKRVTIEVVVMPGDTLWSIARKHLSKQADLRVAVDDIMRVNNLHSGMLRPGQVLLVEVPLDHSPTTSTRTLATGEGF